MPDFILIKVRYVVQVAVDAVTAGDPAPEVLELAATGKENVSEIRPLLTTLSSRSSQADDSRRKWLFLTLAWLSAHESEYVDPLMEVEELAAEFEFPPESYELLRFMPARKRGLVPRTPAEGEQILRRRWIDFVKKQSEIYKRGSGTAR